MELPLTSFNCDRTCKSGHWCRFNPLFKLAGITTKVHSHVAKISTVITDLDRLEFACRQCGLILNRGQTSYRWFGTSVGDYPLPEGMTKEDLGKCTHAISVAQVTEEMRRRYGGESPYEIGVRQRPDGNYDLVWDFFYEGCGIEPLAGKDCAKLLDAYHTCSVAVAAKNLGYLYELTPQGITVYHPAGGSLTLSKDGTVETSGFVGASCHEMRQQLGIEVQDGSIQHKQEAAAALATVGLRG